MMLNATPIRIIILDDLTGMIEIVTNICRAAYPHATLLTFNMAIYAWEEIKRQPPDLLITDWCHRPLPGDELLTLLAKRKARFHIIVFSLVATWEAIQAAAGPELKVSFIDKRVCRPSVLLRHLHAHLGPSVDMIYPQVRIQLLLGVRDSFASLCSDLRGYYQNPVLLDPSDGKEALESMKRNHFDLLITDWHYPSLPGHELIPIIRACAVKIPILVISTVTPRSAIDAVAEILDCIYLIRSPYIKATLHRCLRELVGPPAITSV